MILAVPHIALEKDDFVLNTQVCSLTEICFAISKIIKVRKKQLTNEIVYQGFLRAMTD